MGGARTHARRSFQIRFGFSVRGAGVSGTGVMGRTGSLEGAGVTAVPGRRRHVELRGRRGAGRVRDLDGLAVGHGRGEARRLGVLGVGRGARGARARAARRVAASGGGPAVGMRAVGVGTGRVRAGRMCAGRRCAGRRCAGGRNFAARRRGGVGGRGRGVARKGLLRALDHEACEDIEIRDETEIIWREGAYLGDLQPSHPGGRTRS